MGGVMAGVVARERREMNHELWVLAWQLWGLGKISSAYRDELLLDASTVKF